MSMFSKMFCAKSPFKVSRADAILIEGANKATKKVDKNKLEDIASAVDTVGNVNRDTFGQKTENIDTKYR